MRAWVPNCETLQTAPGRSELSFNLDGRPQTIGIVLRSPYQIFQYLGEMLSEGTASRVMIAPRPGRRPEPMLVVDAATGSCFAGISYEGRSYCVPAEGAGNTKRVFDLMNQILALNTSTSDLPITTTVRIAP